MNSDKIIAGFLLFCVTVLPFILIACNYFYVNNPKRKHRLAELGFGPKNEWAGSKRIDIFSSIYLFATMPGGAYGLKMYRWRGKTNPTGFATHPRLHLDNNYIKFLNEFPIYAKATMVVNALTFLGIASALIFKYVLK